MTAFDGHEVLPKFFRPMFESIGQVAKSGLSPTPDQVLGRRYKIGARPAPKAVKIRVSGRIAGATSGKSPTGV
jgi:hypothetical protein